eukprot:3327857-Pleurochrysis_carterae.AAC.1
MLLLAGGHRGPRLFYHHRTARILTIDFTLRQRPRMPPSSAFALAASDIESHACVAFFAGRVGQAVWSLLNAQVY